jgi:hypothetical protein
MRRKIEDDTPREISAALKKVQAEYAAGTLAPEKQTVILSIFGDDFLR